MKNIFVKIYGLAAGISLFGGIIIFLVLFVGLLLGGTKGESIMVLANYFEPILIKISSLAILIGLVILYIANDHGLTLKKRNMND